MLALRNLVRRPARTLLTALGVAVGIATVVALVAVAKGLRHQFDNVFAADDAHLVLTRKGASDPFISYLPDSLLEPLRAHAGVLEAYPVLLGATQLDGYALFFVCGTSPGSPMLDQVRVIEGRSCFDEGVPERSISVGRSCANHLDLTVGATVDLGGDLYTVSGIFESATPLTEAGAILPFEDAQRVSGQDNTMSGVLVRLVDADLETVALQETAIEAAFPVVEATVPAEFSDAFDEFDLADQAVRVIAVLAVFVGGIGVMNTMLMSVLERTREIGVLQAIGWSKAMILRQIVAEGVIVCLLGGPLGIAIGIGAIEVIGTIGELSWVSGEYGFDVLTLAMAVAVGMGLIGAVYPALRAVRITPIEALRYE